MSGSPVFLDIGHSSMQYNPQPVQFGILVRGQQVRVLPAQPEREYNLSDDMPALVEDNDPDDAAIYVDLPDLISLPDLVPAEQATLVQQRRQQQQQAATSAVVLPK